MDYWTRYEALLAFIAAPPAHLTPEQITAHIDAESAALEEMA
jgi:hypothetical protein